MTNYVRLVADQLGLREWNITVSTEPADEGNLADISISYGQHRATVRFAGDRSRWTPEDTRNTVVHELLHCHLNILTDLMGDIAEAIASEGATDVAVAAHQYVSERIVDALAAVIAPFVPLPDGSL